jgi:multisubunit Na+/H+ antiporter MnhC subunit
MNIVILVAGGVLMSSPAYAYIDPGTGAIILQALVGGVAGGLFLLKLYWQRLKNYFSSDSKGSTEEEPTQHGGDSST